MQSASRILVMLFCGTQSPQREIQLYESRWKLRQSIHRPSRAQESHQQLFYKAGAAAIENKQSLTPTLHRDCGVNNSSSQFYDGFQWTRRCCFTVRGTGRKLSQLCSETSVCDDVWQPGIYTQHSVASVDSAFSDFSSSRELAWITRKHLCSPTEAPHHWSLLIRALI